ncbi:MAG: hypothetical protein K9J06_15115, partial [Flavobacteriales bacterium]|nr:hypothetical protein [Flavobacteriales bacterium]
MMRRHNGLTGPMLALLLSLATISSSAQQWANAYAPYSRHINSSVVLGNGRMVIAGGNPTNDAIRSVFTSNSSGLNWNIDHDFLAPWMWSVDFGGDLTGVAVGNDGTVLRTANGGGTWDSIASGTVNHLRGVHFVDATTVLAVGGQSGATPMQTIIRSTDGGIVWETLLDQAGPMLNELVFIDALTAVAVGVEGTVLRTVDGGNIWTPMVTPSQRDINAIHFSDALSGLAVGGQFTNDSIRTIWTTSDGGATWTSVLDEPGGWLRDIDLVDGSTGYAVGDVSTVLKTTDGGQQWIAVNVPDPDDEVSYNTVSVVSANLVLVAGSHGTIRILHNVAAPTVVTNEALVTAPTTAMLKGTVNSTHGGTYSFLFGTQPDMAGAGETPQVTFAGSGIGQEVSFNIPNLTEGATYYFAAKAATLGGIAIGDTMSVTMTLALPLAQTQGATV